MAHIAREPTESSRIEPSRSTCARAAYAAVATAAATATATVAVAVDLRFLLPVLTRRRRRASFQRNRFGPQKRKNPRTPHDATPLAADQRAEYRGGGKCVPRGIHTSNIYYNNIEIEGFTSRRHSSTRLGTRFPLFSFR